MFFTGLNYKLRLLDVYTGRLSGLKYKLRLLDVFTGRLSGLKYKLIFHFKLMADMVRDGITEFVYDTVKPAFLKRELVEFGVDRYQ